MSLKYSIELDPDATAEQLREALVALDSHNVRLENVRLHWVHNRKLLSLRWEEP